jgi:SOS response regulatory protein OraA/RecX
MYVLKLEDILIKKNKSIKETDTFKKKQKLIQFAMQKGYEYEIINEVLKNIIV